MISRSCYRGGFAQFGKICSKYTFEYRASYIFKYILFTEKIATHLNVVCVVQIFQSLRKHHVDDICMVVRFGRAWPAAHPLPEDWDEASDAQMCNC